MKRQRDPWLLISIAINALILALVLQALLSSPGLFFGKPVSGTIQEQPIRFVTVPPSERAMETPALPSVTPTAPASGIRSPSAAPGIIADRGSASVPRIELPRMDSGSVPAVIPRAGAGGEPAAALVPGFGDSRIFNPAVPVIPGAPLTRADELQGMLDSTIVAYLDSVAGLGNPQDWTVGSGNKKFGIDPQWIYLGPIKLPTFALAMLNLPYQANPNLRERDRTLGAMAAEARYQAAINVTAQAEIARIRERVDRERAARRATQAGSGSKVIPPGTF